MQEHVENLIKRLTSPNQYARKDDIIGMDTAAFAAEFVKRCHQVRQDAAAALVKIGVPAVESLIGQLNSKEQVVRVLSATSLGLIGDAQAVEPLINALADTDDVVRSSAAEALASIGDSRAPDALTPLLQGPEWKVRKAAADAIGKITGARPKVKGACFIATATMGDYEHPTVLVFRDFRDRYLEKHDWGRVFLDEYYKHSPRGAQLIAGNVLLKKLSYWLILKPLEGILKRFCGPVEERVVGKEERNGS